MWELEFDINTVHRYWVSNDKLYVVHRLGDDVEEIEPCYEGRYDSESFREPVDIEID
jgi:hypothetical protein